MAEKTADETHHVQDKREKFRWLTGWSRLFLEMFAIAFGVLLALATTEWREAVEKNAFVEKSLSQIEAEIIRNYEKINEAYEYREQLYPYLLDVESGEKLSAEIPFRGTQGPRLERAAYEVALSNAVFSEIDTELAQRIVSIYLDFAAITDTHKLYLSGVPTLLFSTDTENDPRVGTYLKQAFEDFIFVEGIALDKIVQTNKSDLGSSTKYSSDHGSSTTFDDIERPKQLIERLNVETSNDETSKSTDSSQR